MAFEPKILATLNNCKELVIEDITGLYNGSTNTTGWGDASTLFKLIGDGSPYVTSANLSIKLNGMEVIGGPFNVLTVIQGSGPVQEYTLLTYAPTTNTGKPALFDGVYEITLTLIDENDDKYIVQTTITVYCNVACCVSKLAIRVLSGDCDDCGSKEFDTFQLASTLLNSLDAVSQCLGDDEFLKILTKLQKLCNQKTTGGCGCGCS